MPSLTFHLGDPNITTDEMTLILARTEVLTNHIEMDELWKRDRMVQQQAITGIEWRASRINIRYHKIDIFCENVAQ